MEISRQVDIGRNQEPEDSEEEEEEDDDMSDEEYEELVRTSAAETRKELTISCNQEIDEGDQAILDSYMPQGQLDTGESLGDLIMRKIAAQEEGKDQPIGKILRNLDG